MLHIPRFARLLLVALLLVTIPSIYFFYPGASAPSHHISDGLDAGGIDSAHVRPKAPAVVEDEEERDWEWGSEKAMEMNKVGSDSATTPVETDSKAEETTETTGTTAHHRLPANKDETETDKDKSTLSPTALVTDMLGGVIMPKLGNATAKAELGRATWRFLHTMTLRFPDKPTPDDREALKSFFHLFSRLYPCGECAEHFQKMLKEYPVQTSSRKNASLWLCVLHNIVNARLHKPEFDCLTLDKTYDCGCGNETTSATATPGAAKTNTAAVGEK